MIPPTLDLDINTKHTNLQTLARRDKEREREKNPGSPIQYIQTWLELVAKRWPISYRARILDHALVRCTQNP